MDGPAFAFQTNHGWRAMPPACATTADGRATGRALTSCMHHHSSSYQLCGRNLTDELIDVGWEEVVAHARYVAANNSRQAWATACHGAC